MPDPIIYFNAGPNQKLVIGIAAEGYTAGETSKFISDAINALSGIYAIAPVLGGNQSKISVVLFPETSNVSWHDLTALPTGALDTAYGVFIQTSGAAQFWSFSNSAKVVENKILSPIQPVDVVLILVNNPLFPGGAAGYLGGTLAIIGGGESTQTKSVMAHELGHLLPDATSGQWLGDEYGGILAFPAGTLAPGGVRNIDTLFGVSSNGLKWAADVGQEGIGQIADGLGYAGPEVVHPHASCGMGAALFAPVSGFYCRVCRKGIEELLGAPSVVPPPVVTPPPPIIVSPQPVDGEVSIPAGLTQITFTLSKPEAPDGFKVETGLVRLWAATMAVSPTLPNPREFKVTQKYADPWKVVFQRVVFETTSPKGFSIYYQFDLGNGVWSETSQVTGVAVNFTT